MKFAIVECATSDKLDYRLPADDASQPRLAQLAIILLDDVQGAGKHLTYTVRPEAWSMAADAASATGLSDETLARDGNPLHFAVSAYANLIVEHRVIVSYSTTSVLKIMRGECRRLDHTDFYERTSSIELMRALTDICRIPNVGRKGYKMPKMSEALAHFKIDAPDIRDAATTARLSLGLFRAMVDLRRLPEPKLPTEV